MKTILFLCAAIVSIDAQPLRNPVVSSLELPTGWRLSPVGTLAETNDMLVDMTLTPDRRFAVAVHAGYNPHGLVLIDPDSRKIVQRIPLPAAWSGLTWDAAASRLYVSGGSGAGTRSGPPPLYAFHYFAGHLEREPERDLTDTENPKALYWSGLFFLPKRHLLFAANQGNGTLPTSVHVFDTETRAVIARIPVEVNPYAIVASNDLQRIFVSNWASRSVSVIDSKTLRVVRAYSVGANPTAMIVTPDSRLFVACSNEDSIYVIDLKHNRPTERISTDLFPMAPGGATPNALALDWERRALYAANADNNDVAVIDVAKPGSSRVRGFIPSGWYPTSLALLRGKLIIGNSRGSSAFNDIYGPNSPLREPNQPELSVRTLQKGAVQILATASIPASLAHWTDQVYQNTPYTDERLANSPAPAAPSIIPTAVGIASPVRHVIYIIKENRTYDQVLGDLPQGEGDARLVLFGRNVTPNHHALVEQFVLLDHLFASGEVSASGHSWSDAAYATDFAEKRWPVLYSGRGNTELSNAYAPGGGFIWDLCNRKGLTYRSYGEYGVQVSGGAQIDATAGASLLYGHIAPGYRRNLDMRDTENAALFIKEFDQFEQNFDSAEPTKRLPNFIIMSLPEDHTRGTRAGAYTPTAMVANNDYALGLIVERVTHSKYWPETAIFIVEDDAQDGPDHIDARRTIGFAISPYIKHGSVDKTPYTTASMLRTMELLLGLPPMTQFDAAAPPMYAAFGTEADLAPYQHIKPQVDVNAKNTSKSFGAAASARMDFDDVDEAPMFELNEILWKSIKGADSPMPLPVHRYLGH